MPMRKPDYIPSWLASDTQVLISPNKAAIGYIKLLTQMRKNRLTEGMVRAVA